MAINYALFKNRLNGAPNNYVALVQNQTSRTKEDLIDEMISRGSTVTKAEAISVLEEFEAAIERALLKGDSINTPIFRIKTSIQGVFHEETDVFDYNQHNIRLNINPGSRIRKMVGNIKVEKVDANTPIPVIRNFWDIASQTKNEAITPGGVGEISGSRLKVDESDEKQGIFLLGTNGSVTKIETIIRNKPSNLLFFIPYELSKGKYQLEVRALFQHTTTLKVGRQVQHLVVASRITP